MSNPIIQRYFQSIRDFENARKRYEQNPCQLTYEELKDATGAYNKAKDDYDTFNDTEKKSKEIANKALSNPLSKETRLERIKDELRAAYKELDLLKKERLDLKNSMRENIRRRRELYNQILPRLRQEKKELKEEQ